MRFFVKLSLSVVVTCALLEACWGSPACPCQAANCPCQSQSANCPCQSQLPVPPNVPCDNCNYSCKNVSTLNVTAASLVPFSPLYQVIITVEQGSKQIDSICMTYLPLNGQSSFVQFITTTYCDGSYSVGVVLTSDTGKPGYSRQEGLLNESGESSVVVNSYAFGSVSCLNYTSLPLNAFYACNQFSDCSLSPASAAGDNLLVLSDTPDLSGVCLDQAEALFDQSGLQKGVLARPPNALGPMCVTSFNGAPCVNADRVPASSAIAYPPPPCGCSCAC